MENRLQLRAVRLDRLVTGGFAEVEHRLLGDSPHVEFLREFGGADTIDLEKFRRSSYYRHACGDIKRLGSFFGITDPNRIVEQAEYFLALHRAVRDNGGIALPNARAGNTQHHSRTDPLVAPVAGRAFYVIKDGHHRCAVHFVLGRETIPARVGGTARLTASELDSLLVSAKPPA